jgi:hypothetical protein
MFVQRPAGWLMIVIGYIAIQFVVGRVAFELGPLGTLAAFLLRPVFGVGFLAAAWSQERGEKLRPGHLFSGFRSNVWHLLVIGALFPAVLAGAIFASSMLDGGALLDIVLQRKPAEPDPEQAARLARSMLFVLGCAVPAVLATWFAAALVVFQDLTPAKAFAASFRACIGNWRPMLTYAMLVFVLGGILPSVLNAMLGTMLGLSPADNAVLVLLLPYLLPLATVMQITDYVSYRDVFHADETIDRPGMGDVRSGSRG